MWEIYDRLIEGIPDDISILDVYSGETWSYVHSDGGFGVAMTLNSAMRPPMQKKRWTDCTLKECAKYVKSWNFKEASLGLSAINSWYNTEKNLRKMNVVRGTTNIQRDAFLTYQEEVKGKNVAVVGHFPFLEKRFAPICNLSILERIEKEGDYPDTACEYLLPEQDYVFITGVTFINKTVERLLQLAKNSTIIMVGPSVPMAEVLFEYGITALEGFQVEKEELGKKLIQSPSNQGIFQCGHMISVKKNSIRM